MIDLLPVDYVRRSLSEVGSRDDDQPPPLPVKTSTQRRAPPLHCVEARATADDVIASTWEPTHMTWDEVRCVHACANVLNKRIVLVSGHLSEGAVVRNWLQLCPPWPGVAIAKG